MEAYSICSKHESHSSDFRKAMGCFATGVTVITVDQGGEVHGMTANAFPPYRSIHAGAGLCGLPGANPRSSARPKRFGVNVLRSDQQAISEYYARSSETHQHAEEAGAHFDRTRKELQCSRRSRLSRMQLARAEGGRPHHLHRRGGRGSGPGGRAAAVFSRQYREIEPTNNSEARLSEVNTPCPLCPSVVYSFLTSPSPASRSSPAACSTCLRRFFRSSNRANIFRPDSLW